MQKLFASIKQDLGRFIQQRDDIALAVQCRDDEAIPLVKLVEELDDQSATEMFWICSDDFNDPASYASAVAATFAVKHGSVSLALLQSGSEPWPPLPQSVLDESLNPAIRLRELMAFSRELLPDPDGFLAVWALMPFNIFDPQGYALLMSQVLQHEFPLPWCHHLRFIIRSQQDDSVLASALAPVKHIAWYAPDLSQETLVKALEDETSDPAVPLDLRLHNVFVLANVDYSFGRVDEALKKYQVLLKYYVGTQNPTMTALVLNGIGEVHQRRGALDQAVQCFHAALTPAAGAPGPAIPALLNITLNLGNLWMGQQQWELAEGHYDAAQNFATLQRAPDTKLRAMENLGLCKYNSGKVAEALGVWNAGASVAGELEMPRLQESMLQRLRSHYSAAGDYQNVAELDRRLAQVAALGRS